MILWKHKKDYIKTMRKIKEIEQDIKIHQDRLEELNKELLDMADEEIEDGLYDVFLLRLQSLKRTIYRYGERLQELRKEYNTSLKNH